MRILGLEIRYAPQLRPVGDSRGGWFPLIREPFTGAWQRNQEWTTDTVLAHHAVYACITLIASDIGKLRPKLVEMDSNGIWAETTSPAFSPVLRKPNHFQNRIQFIESWITSKLIHGNTYVLKERDNRGVVRALYLLDPTRVTVLVAPDGQVFYQLKQDLLSGLGESEVAVPAANVIHDRMNCLFHPLVGTSPIFASGAAANMGLHIERNSSNFFGGGSNPSGILSSPQAITSQKQKEYSEIWKNYSPGDIAVVDNGMVFTQLRMSAVESQLIDQLKWSAETVCRTYHVPPFKLGIGSMPTYNNAELLNQIYYSDCLQSLIEQLELCFDDGLGLMEPKEGKTLGVELDLDALLRMDTATQIEALGKSVGAGIHAPNEARHKLDLKPVKGGATPYLQQQNYSLAALDERDRNDPFPKKPDPPLIPLEDESSPDTDDDAEPAEDRMAALATIIDLYATTMRIAA